MAIRSMTVAVLLSLVASGATLTINPAVISTCVSGLGAAAGYAVLVELLDSTGKAVFQRSTQPALAANRDYIRVPMYTGQTPFTLVPPGNYTLVGNMTLAGTTVASASIGVEVK